MQAQGKPEPGPKLARSKFQLRRVQSCRFWIDPTHGHWRRVETEGS